MAKSIVPKVPAISEAQFQKQIIQYAHLKGWRVAHFRPALRQSGKWSTPVAADGAGFPDLVLCRERVLWLEVKTDKGKVRPEQERWLQALNAAGQLTYVVRPQDWQTLMEILQ